MTFTDKPPTEPGFYAWKKDDKQHWPYLGEIEFVEGSLHWNRNKMYKIEGLWCRLVPAEEVEKAFEEGKCRNFGWGCSWDESRAKRVAEGKEP